MAKIRISLEETKDNYTEPTTRYTQKRSRLQDVLHYDEMMLLREGSHHAMYVHDDEEHHLGLESMVYDEMDIQLRIGDMPPYMRERVFRFFNVHGDKVNLNDWDRLMAYNRNRGPKDPDVTEVKLDEAMKLVKQYEAKLSTK